ncbi:hypothetical protein ThvES_00002960 [Thiovulum sp. ES]|nr:hypothetical protein ThvES_00002960 [Thiovulum sp. ES]
METLSKVEKALDLRFEKDNTLYISKNDNEVIRKAISNSSIQDLKTLSQKHGTKIFSKVLLKNSWLIKENFFQNKNVKDFFKKTLLSLPPQYFTEISKDVVENNIYADTNFREFLNSLYNEKASLDDCKKTFANKSEMVESRTECFERIVKDYMKTKEHLLPQFLESEFKKNPEIFNYTKTKDSQFFQSIFTLLSDKRDIANWILENKNDKDRDAIWFKSLEHLGEDGFDALMEFIANNSHDKNMLPFLVRGVLSKFHKLNSFEDEIVDAYTDYDFLSMKGLFIQMLEPPRFKSKEKAQNIISELKNQGVSFSDKEQKVVESIENWSDSSGFNSLKEFLNKLNGNPQFNIARLYYLSRNLERNTSLVKQIVNSHGGDGRVKKVLAYHFARNIGNYKIFQQINGLPKDLIDQIGNNLVELHSRHRNTETFSQRYRHYKLIEFLQRRV